jgi:hypothetical protein
MSQPTKRVRCVPLQQVRARSLLPAYGFRRPIVTRAAASPAPCTVVRPFIGPRVTRANIPSGRPRLPRLRLRSRRGHSGG